MTYFIIPLFNNKEENKIILDILKQNMSKVDSDDFILGFFPISNSTQFKTTISNDLRTLGVKVEFNEQSNSFLEITDDFLNSIVGDKNINHQTKIVIILTYFALFGLTIKPIANKESMINKVLLNSAQSIPIETTTWLNDLILINGFYHVETNYPFNEFEISEYFSIDHFMKLFKFFLKCY